MNTASECVRVRRKIQCRPLRPELIDRALIRARATAGQDTRLVAHCAAIADPLDRGWIEDAHDLLDTAEHGVSAGANTPSILHLLRRVMLPREDDYVPHRGGACPVAADVLVAVDLGEGRPLVDRAGALCWGPGTGPAGEGRIHRWARVPGA